MKDLDASRYRWIAVLTAVLLTLGGTQLASAQEADTMPNEAEMTVQVEMAFGTGIDPTDRSLVGEATAFAADVGKVFCYTRITGVAGIDTVTHAWYHEGRTMARVDLPVKATHWRTWSSKRVLPGWTGLWEVKILDRTGKVLASDGFELQ